MKYLLLSALFILGSCKFSGTGTPTENKITNTGDPNNPDIAASTLSFDATGSGVDESVTAIGCISQVAYSRRSSTLDQFVQHLPPAAVSISLVGTTIITPVSVEALEANYDTATIYFDSQCDDLTNNRGGRLSYSLSIGSENYTLNRRAFQRFRTSPSQSGYIIDYAPMAIIQSNVTNTDDFYSLFGAQRANTPTNPNPLDPNLPQLAP